MRRLLAIGLLWLVSTALSCSSPLGRASKDCLYLYRVKTTALYELFRDKGDRTDCVIAFLEDPANRSIRSKVYKALLGEKPERELRVIVIARLYDMPLLGSTGPADAGAFFLND